MERLYVLTGLGTAQCLPSLRVRLPQYNYSLSPVRVLMWAIKFLLVLKPFMFNKPLVTDFSVVYQNTFRLKLFPCVSQGYGVSQVRVLKWCFFQPEAFPTCFAGLKQVSFFGPDS